METNIDINENNTAGSQLNTLFSVVASWAPENNNFSSPGKILRVQQLALHTKYSKFQKPVGLLSDKFHRCLPIERCVRHPLFVHDWLKNT
jgi:hypothetical protein